MQPRKAQPSKGPSQIEISSKSMSLAEGITLRGIREIKSNSAGFSQSLSALMSKPTKNQKKTWENFGKLIPRYYEFSAQATPRLDSQKQGRNKFNRDLIGAGQWYWFERYSPKLIRIWLAIPDFNHGLKRFEPAIFPVITLSHHALSRIFYRKKDVNSFKSVISEILCPNFLENITVLALARESRDAPPEHLEMYLELSSQFSEMGLGTPVGCVETKNGFMMLREPDPDDDHIQPEPGTISEMFHQTIKKKTVMVGSTWIPRDKVKQEQLRFIKDTRQYWLNVRSYIESVKAVEQE